jgi:hypothetical protein
VLIWFRRENLYQVLVVIIKIKKKSNVEKGASSFPDLICLANLESPDKRGKHDTSCKLRPAGALFSEKQ